MPPKAPFALLPETLSKPAGKVLKSRLCLRFGLDGKHYESKAFPERERHYNFVISLTEFSRNTNIKLPAIIAFLSLFGVVYGVMCSKTRRGLSE